MTDPQDVLVYDVEEAARIIQREDGVHEMTAMNKAETLGNTHPALFPLVRAWLERGEYPEFEFQGVTLAFIREKQKGGYRDAIGTMSWLLKNPDEVEWFRSHDFPIM